jgi:hypothetical protein
MLGSYLLYVDFYMLLLIDFLETARPLKVWVKAMLELEIKPARNLIILI